MGYGFSKDGGVGLDMLFDGVRLVRWLVLENR